MVDFFHLNAILNTTHQKVVPVLNQVGEMPLNIKNPAVEKLVAEVAQMAGETKTEAVRRALEERKSRLAFRESGRDSSTRLRALLTQEVWPRIPREEMGRTLTRDEEEAILGYGEQGT